METTLNTQLMPQEKEILKALLRTCAENAELYTDISRALPDIHPEELKRALEGLQMRHLVRYLAVSEGEQMPARITEEGISILKKNGVSTGFMLKNKKLLTYAATFTAMLFFALLIVGGGSGELFKIDVTGTGLNTKTKEILRQWIEDQEQENSDNYTFSLMEEDGPRKNYLVECKSENSDDCKYNIIFIELDEDSKEITNVELPRE